MLKKSKLILALALSLFLCFASFTAAFAAQAQNGDNGTPGNPGAYALGGTGAVVSTDGASVQAAITKVLQTPVGTTIPGNAFTFTATPISVDGNSTAAAKATMPALVNLTATPAAPGVTSGNTTTYTKETGDIFAGTIAAAGVTPVAGTQFPHAGIYVYDVTENSPTYANSSTPNETMTYSTAKYELTVYVENVMEEKDPVNYPGVMTPVVPHRLYIAAVGDVILVTDNNSQTVNYKVNPTPGTLNSGAPSQMTFTNTYVKTTGHPNNPNPSTPGDQTLSVSKTVAGSFGDLTKYFGYTMTVLAPDLVFDPNYDPSDPLNIIYGNLPKTAVTANPVPFVTTAPIYSAYILDANGTPVGAADLTDSAKNNVKTGGVTVTPKTDANGKAYFEVTSGIPFTYSLQHGQTLVFTNTPVGTAYGVNETGNANYYPDVTVTYNGDAADIAKTANFSGSTNLAGALNTDAVIPVNNPYNPANPIYAGAPPAPFPANAPATLVNLVGEGANSAAFTNTYQSVSLTGIIMKDLPYVGLIVLAIGAFIAFIAVKSRKRKSYSK